MRLKNYLNEIKTKDRGNIFVIPLPDFGYLKMNGYFSDSQEANIKNINATIESINKFPESEILNNYKRDLGDATERFNKGIKKDVPGAVKAYREVLKFIKGARYKASDYSEFKTYVRKIKSDINHIITFLGVISPTPIQVIDKSKEKLKVKLKKKEEPKPIIPSDAQVYRKNHLVEASMFIIPNSIFEKFGSKTFIIDWNGKETFKFTAYDPVDAKDKRKKKVKSFYPYSGGISTYTEWSDRKLPLGTYEIQIKKIKNGYLEIKLVGTLEFPN